MLMSVSLLSTNRRVTVGSGGHPSVVIVNRSECEYIYEAQLLCSTSDSRR